MAILYKFTYLKIVILTLRDRMTSDFPGNFISHFLPFETGFLYFFLIFQFSLYTETLFHVKHFEIKKCLT